VPGIARARRCLGYCLNGDPQQARSIESTAN
jgi:hypothetical protein